MESSHVDVWQGGDVECRTSRAARTAALHHWRQPVPSEQEFNSKSWVHPSALILWPQFPRLGCCLGARHRSLVLAPRRINQRESSAHGRENARRRLRAEPGSPHPRYFHQNVSRLQRGLKHEFLQVTCQPSCNQVYKERQLMFLLCLCVPGSVC